MIDRVEGSRSVKQNKCSYFAIVHRVDEVIVDRDKSGFSGVEFAIC